MVNKISEKFFTQNDFSMELARALEKIIDGTGFKINQEIWRGVIYDKNKVGSIIFDGKYKNKPAVLKIQGLKPELDEIEIIKLFKKFNQSKQIEVPTVFIAQKWNKQDRFGFLIQEKLNAAKIFTPPFASERQISNFCGFYNEYRTKTVATPWWKCSLSTKKFIFDRLDTWIKINQSKKAWNAKTFASRITRFKQLIEKHHKKIPLLFSHGHLSANDIYVKGGKYYLLSNLFWGYRPKYYDLAFNLWANLLRLPPSYTFKQALTYINKWLVAYHAIPWVTRQNDFNETFPIILCERLLGSLIIDLGIKRHEKNFKKRLFNIHLQLFDYFLKQTQ